VLADRSLGDGKLTLMFDPATYELKQWVVTDAQGYDTSVAIYNVASGKKQDPQLFRIYVSHGLGR
jgi:outer membrane lipoprotein-sorting protein